MQGLLKQSILVKCSKCSGGLFQSLTVLRKISKLYVPGSSSDILIPIQVLKCDACGTVNEEFLPDALPNLSAELGIKKIQLDG